MSFYKRQSTDHVVRFHTRQSLYFVLIITALIFVFFTLLYKQHCLHEDHQATLLTKNFLKQVFYLQNLLDTVSAQVEGMRIKAETDLLETRGLSVLNPPLAFKHLADGDGGQTFNIDHFTLPLTRDMIGNMTGQGSIRHREDDFYREIHMALRLNPDFRSIADVIPDAAWIYYTSKNDFINIYPWVSSNYFKFSKEIHTHEFFTSGLPEKNPDRELFWTDLYIDEYGKGLMTTCAAPVYDEGRFMGTVAIDLTVDFLNTLVKGGTTEQGIMLLVNDKNKVVAHPWMITSGNQRTMALKEALPASVYDSMDLLRRIGNAETVRIGDFTVLMSQLRNPPWRLIYYQPVTPAWISMMDQIGLGAGVLMGGVLMLVIAGLVLTHIQVVKPSEKFVYYIMSRSQGKAFSLQGWVPSAWRPWFAAIENTFRQKESLEYAIRKQNRDLERRVRDRILELDETNRQFKIEIGERVQAENALRMIFDSVHDAIFVYELDGTVRQVNDKMLEMFRVSPENALRFSISDDYSAHNDDDARARMLDNWKRAIAGETLVFEWKVRRPGDGSDFDAEIMLKKITLNSKDMILANVRDITERKRAEEALREKEAYLRTIMETIQAGILIIDPETRQIEYANPFAAKMIGNQPEKLVGRNCHEYICSDRVEACPMPTPCREINADRILKTTSGGQIHVRMSYAPVKLKNKTHFLQSLSDITDIKDLLKLQEINIGLARGLLKLTNGMPPRHTELADNLTLFFDALSVPCWTEGGDHYFVRNVSGDAQGGYGKTILSLKDQSGHKVGCVLRSIVTDLIHHSILSRDRSQPLESSIAELNDAICRSRLFRDDEFFTSVNIEINHETLALRYVSAGNPPFLLIRGNDIISFPDTGGAGANVPLTMLSGVSFSAGEYQLQAGDKLIFYTDGLTEMPLKNRKRILTIEEMKGVVSKILHRNREMVVSEIMEEVLMSISQTSKEMVVPADDNAAQKNTSDDDVTILCLEIENQETYDEIVLNPRNDDEVSDFIQDVYLKIVLQWHQRGFEAPEMRIRTVLEEALLNAWRHGNRCDPEKNITVRWRFGNDFHIMVLDEGEGFEYTNITDPTSRENITRTFGRGIFIIRHFADFVDWKEGGRQLQVSFRKKQSAVKKAEEEKQGDRFMKLWEHAEERDEKSC